jgi:hypothetical protein
MGNQIHAVFGIDQLGTSREALDFALANFDSTRITHEDAGSPISPTFHPKVYLFTGKHSAICFLGSNNLTVGGTETNFEAATVLTLTLPADQAVLSDVSAMWKDVAAASLELAPSLIADLVDRGWVVSEKEQRKARKAAAAAVTSKLKKPPATKLFPKVGVKPPSPLPKHVLQPVGHSSASTSLAVAAANSAETLVMQILPHPNGEVFLSKTAVDENPDFFGWPFSGTTTPKKAGNIAYPQRLPDPRVNVRVFDGAGMLVIEALDYALNTVYYSTKSEIRITFRPDIIAAAPAYSILVMAAPTDGGSNDYDISIFAPGSGRYAELLVVCNQTMPSGGKPSPRKFGWL